ncbi:hypothetical protein IAT38_000123 [Cryptococcus sp. DSM 104549]
MSSYDNNTLPQIVLAPSLDYTIAPTTDGTIRFSSVQATESPAWSQTLPSCAGCFIPTSGASNPEASRPADPGYHVMSRQAHLTNAQLTGAATGYDLVEAENIFKRDLILLTALIGRSVCGPEDSCGASTNQHDVGVLSLASKDIAGERGNVLTDTSILGTDELLQSSNALLQHRETRQTRMTLPDGRQAVRSSWEDAPPRWEKGVEGASAPKAYTTFATETSLAEKLNMVNAKQFNDPHDEAEFHRLAIHVAGGSSVGDEAER